MLTRGAITDSLYTMLKGSNEPEISADEARDSVLAEFERLGGGERE